jgi:hypothetical protein
MHRSARFASWLAVPFTALLAGAGCGSPVPSLGTSDDPVRIHPGGEENLSTLVLQLPAGACLPGSTCARPLAKTPALSLDGQAMSLGTGLRVLPGAHVLTVDRVSTTVTLVAGLTRTLTLPVAREVCSYESWPDEAVVEFGRAPSLRYAECPTRVSLDGKLVSYQPPVDIYFNSANNCAGSWYGPYDLRSFDCSTLGGYAGGVWLGSHCVNTTFVPRASLCRALQENRCSDVGIDSGYCPSVNPFAGNFDVGTDVAVVPGDYGFAIETNAGPGSDVRTLHEGDLSTLAFRLPVLGAVPPIFRTNLVFAEPRELPDAASASITSNCENNYYVPSNAAGTLSLRAYRFAECNYVFSAAGRTVALSQTNDNGITLYRIDVDHVTVTREDHTTYETVGTYELYYQSQLVAGPYTTNSGIDVLPGTYDLVVRYQTAEGPKVNHYPLTF